MGKDTPWLQSCAVHVSSVAAGTVAGDFAIVVFIDPAQRGEVHAKDNPSRSQFPTTALMVLIVKGPSGQQEGREPRGGRGPILHDYNFGRIHQTLRGTPAMEAGVANHVWSVEEIVGLLE